MPRAAKLRVRVGSRAEIGIGPLGAEIVMVAVVEGEGGEDVINK